MVKKSKISVCKNCGNPLPEKATVCPSCGAKNKKPIYKKWWFWLIIVLIVAGIISNRNNESVSSDNLPSSLVSSGAEKDATSGDAPSANESNEPDVSATPEGEDAQSSSESAPSVPETPELIDGMRPEFKEAMDTYEAFFDEYIAFMKKYAESDGTDLELLSDYADYMSKYAETMEAFEEWENKDLNTAETAYYIEVQTRISQKLLQVAQQVPQ